MFWAELPELCQGRVWAPVPTGASGSGTVYHKPISKGMTGMELAVVACLRGLAGTVAGPEKEGRRSRFKEGGCWEWAWKGTVLTTAHRLRAAVGEGQKESDLAWPGREMQDTDVVAGA